MVRQSKKRTRKKTALITGITGQDGSYLAELLLSKNYNVVGIIRKTSHSRHVNIGHIQDKLNLIYGDLLDSTSLKAILKSTKPDEIYNLAAQSSPGESFKQPMHTAEITGIGAHRVFDAARDICPNSKIYQASSSEMYGWVRQIPQDEETPFNPANPYAVAKLYAHNIAKVYRKSYDMFISCGILFNHESPRRNMGFVTQKVTYAAACAKLGIKNSLHLNEQGEPIVKRGKVALGNLNAKRDWGYASDFVEAMWLMLQQKKSDDFVIATNSTHSVKQLCMQAYKSVGANWKKHVAIDQRFVRPTETGPLVGNYSKAKRKLGWAPKTTFEKLVKTMVNMHIKGLKKMMSGQLPYDPLKNNGIYQ